MTNVINANMPTSDFNSAVAAALPDSLAERTRDLKQSEAALAKATSETQRLGRVRWDLQSQITELNAKLKALRIRAFENVAYERPKNATPLFKEITNLRAERDDLMLSMSYVASFLFEQSAINELECQVAERTATARLFEGQALDMRQRALQAASSAAQIDPGFALDMKESKSQKLLLRAQEIYRMIRALQDDLAKKRIAVAKEQDLAAPSIFNV